MTSPDINPDLQCNHRLLFGIEGAILVILGVIAIAVPPIATLSLTVFLGWLLVISGVAGVITTFGARNAPGFWWSLLSVVIALAAGFSLLYSPVGGAISLTLLLIVFFAAEGVATILFATSHRDASGRWGWLLASGIVDLLLAGIILMGLPGTAVWALGLLLGINLLFGGLAMLTLALNRQS